MLNQTVILLAATDFLADQVAALAKQELFGIKCAKVSWDQVIFVNRILNDVQSSQVISIADRECLLGLLNIFSTLPPEGIPGGK